MKITGDEGWKSAAVQWIAMQNDREQFIFIKKFDFIALLFSAHPIDPEAYYEKEEIKSILGNFCVPFLISLAGLSDDKEFILKFLLDNFSHQILSFAEFEGVFAILHSPLVSFSFAVDLLLHLKGSAELVMIDQDLLSCLLDKINSPRRLSYKVSVQFLSIILFRCDETVWLNTMSQVVDFLKKYSSKFNFEQAENVRIVHFGTVNEKNILNYMRFLDLISKNVDFVHFDFKLVDYFCHLIDKGFLKSSIHTIVKAFQHLSDTIQSGEGILRFKKIMGVVLINLFVSHDKKKDDAAILLNALKITLKMDVGWMEIIEGACIRVGHTTKYDPRLLVQSFSDFFSLNEQQVLRLSLIIAEHCAENPVEFLIGMFQGMKKPIEWEGDVHAPLIKFLNDGTRQSLNELLLGNIFERMVLKPKTGFELISSMSIVSISFIAKTFKHYSVCASDELLEGKEEFRNCLKVTFKAKEFFTIYSMRRDFLYDKYTSELNRPIFEIAKRMKLPKGDIKKILWEKWLEIIEDFLNKELPALRKTGKVKEAISKKGKYGLMDQLLKKVDRLPFAQLENELNQILIYCLEALRKTTH